MKTAKLTGALLDYWVAQLERSAGVIVTVKDGSCFMYGSGDPYLFCPSLSWAQGGPIIEREGISVMKWEIPNDAGMTWSARNLTANIHMDGQTPLIAAMRAYIASKFGDTVPDEVAS